MPRRRNAVRLGIPAIIVAALAIIALWRVGPPPEEPHAVGTNGVASAAEPLRSVAEVLGSNVVGRQASLERVRIREVVTDRTYWIGSGDERAFVVLDPDVKRIGIVRMVPGARVTLVGLVRPAPEPEQAMRDWHVDAETARSIKERGTYLHVTELRAG